MGIPNHTRILLISDDERATREYGINRPAVLTLFGLGLLLAGCLTVLLIAYAIQVKETREIGRMRAELTEARQRVATVDRLNRELEEMRSFQEHVLTALGVEPLDRSSADIASTTGATDASHDLGATETPLSAMADLQGGNNLDRLRQAAAMVQSPRPESWPTTGYVTREFIAGNAAQGVAPHPGIDIAAPEDTPIVAAADGEILRTGSDDFLGNYVEIGHGLGYLTVYGHCSRLAVQPGTRVKRGQIVAYLGQSGQTSAPHLHFEIWKEGEAVDPRTMIEGDPPR